MKKLLICLILILSFGLFAVGCSEKTPGEGGKETETMPTDGVNIFVSADAAATGDGSENNPYTLEAARDAVRKMSKDKPIYVLLRGGTYFREEAFVLTEEDSGAENAVVTWQNYPNETPLISGGKEVTGWVYDEQNDWYVAEVGKDLPIRNLFIDGERRPRASISNYPLGKTTTGYRYNGTPTAPFDTMANWRNPSDIELVASNSWKSFRIKVDRIEGNEFIVDPAQFSKGNATGAYGLPDGIDRVENAFELMDAAGEWYYDRTEGKIYAIPEGGETDFAEKTAIVPITDELFRITGNAGEPGTDITAWAQHIRVRGLSFAFDSYSEVEETGYIEHQAGVLQAGPNWMDFYRTPGGVVINSSQYVTIENCTFEHMGKNALIVEDGSKHITIQGNTFSDISADGIMIANVRGEDPRVPGLTSYSDHHPSNSDWIVEYITIADNYITKVGAEFYSNVAIWVGYAREVTIEYNTCYDLPYTAISCGWGWGYPDDNYTPIAGNNTIRYNRIDLFMQEMNDGGAIYTLGEQPGTEIVGNYVSQMMNNYAYIYMDNGSTGITVQDNFIDGTAGNCQNWLVAATFITEPVELLAHDIYADGNFYTTGMTIFRQETWYEDIRVGENTEVTSAQDSAVAEIISNAGVRKG